MIPKASQGGRATGTSFKGVFQYLNHDKRQDGETVSTSSDRVDWVATRNLATDDPEMASRIMVATARQQDDIKISSGGSVAGNKSDQVVFHYSLGWHPSEKDGLTKSEMLRAADESIRAIGGDDHQAMIYAHNDVDHPHVHVVLNRVNPDHGKMLNLWKYQTNLSKWALSYEQERGKVLCNERVNNWRERDNGQVFTADKWESWHQFNEAGDLKNANDNAGKRLYAEQKEKDAALSAKGETMHKRHSQEWKDLSEVYKQEKNRILGRDDNNGQKADNQKTVGKKQQTPFQKAAADIKAQFKPLWQELFKSQTREKSAFKQREAHLKGKIENAIAAVKQARMRDPEASRGFISMAFNYMISSKAREQELGKAHDRGIRTLRSAQSAEITKSFDTIRKTRSEALQKHCERFGVNRKALKEKQSGERSELRQEWKTRKEERERVNKIIQKRDTIRENSKDTPAPEEAKQKEKFNRVRRARSQNRKRKGRSRSLSQKRSD